MSARMPQHRNALHEHLNNAHPLVRVHTLPVDEVTVRHLVQDLRFGNDRRRSHKRV